MSIAGRVASAAGYLWLLLAALSGTGVLGEIPFRIGGALYALVLIFLGRALRKRARARSEPDIVVEAVPPPTPPILIDAGAAPPPPRPRAAPKPPASPLSPATTEPGTAPVEPLLPMPGPAKEHKTSRQRVDEARARWGRQSR
jgi:hypothetical protein